MRSNLFKIVIVIDSIRREISYVKKGKKRSYFTVKTRRNKNDDKTGIIVLNHCDLLCCQISYKPRYVSSLVASRNGWNWKTFGLVFIKLKFREHNNVLEVITGERSGREAGGWVIQIKTITSDVLKMIKGKRTAREILNLLESIYAKK